jgi:hypothetical protein
VGSSCTWGSEELEQFRVTVQLDKDPTEMIPAVFFNFDQLQNYAECML